jgi:hypothetical protein
MKTKPDATITSTANTTIPDIQPPNGNLLSQLGPLQPSSHSQE